jgi:hypothetical protein
MLASFAFQNEEQMILWRQIKINKHDGAVMNRRQKMMPRTTKEKRPGRRTGPFRDALIISTGAPFATKTIAVRTLTTC